MLVTLVGMPWRSLAGERGSRVILHLASVPDLIRFNRVEGLTLGLGGEVETTGRGFAALGTRLAYAVTAGRVRYDLRGGFGWRHASGRLRLSAGIFDRTDTLGVRPVGIGGNTPLAFLFKYDALDYCGRRGWSLELSEQWRSIGVRLAAGRERSYSLVAASPATFSPFGGTFRENPAVDDGPLGFFDADLRIEAVTQPGVYPRGHRHVISVRRGEAGVAGPRAFTRLEIASDLYLRGLHSQLVTLHLAAGAATAPLPRQEGFGLGGPTTLRGEESGGQWGNHLWYAAIDHYLPSGPLGRLRWPNPLWHALRPIVFADAGAAWDPGTFGGTRAARTRASAGLALGDTGHLFRVNVAWPIGGRRPRLSALLTYAW